LELLHCGVLRREAALRGHVYQQRNFALLGPKHIARTGE